jgi:REP element-mobilizing transposase RayT
MDRYWFISWTTYGSWLPGDERGFVGQLKDDYGLPYSNSLPGTPCDADIPALESAMRQAMKGPSIRLTLEQAEGVVAQFQETAHYREWLLLAAAVMANHVHLVVGVLGDPDPEKILHDFKSYASRVLNRKWSRPPNGTWWTESGSKRKLGDDQAVADGVQYVRDQEFPLVVWINEEAMRRFPAPTKKAKMGERGQ